MPRHRPPAAMAEVGKKGEIQIDWEIARAMADVDSADVGRCGGLNADQIVAFISLFKALEEGLLQAITSTDVPANAGGNTLMRIYTWFNVSQLLFHHIGSRDLDPTFQFMLACIVVALGFAKCALLGYILLSRCGGLNADQIAAFISFFKALEEGLLQAITPIDVPANAGGNTLMRIYTWFNVGQLLILHTGSQDLDPTVRFMLARAVVVLAFAKCALLGCILLRRL